MMTLLRTFIAVDAASSSIAKLQNEIMSSKELSSKAFKPVAAQNFHFTLIFLGEKSENDISKIKSKMDEIQFEPFTLVYSGVGAFPKPTHARVIWIGVEQEGRDKLIKLANDVIARMAEIGFRPDKPFSPHLTIFRARDRPIQLENIVAKYQHISFGSDIIDKIHLKTSELTPLGPNYSNIYNAGGKK